MADRNLVRRAHARLIERLERNVFQQVVKMLTAFLVKASQAVLGAFRRFGVQPDPAGVWSAQPDWNVAVAQLIDGLLEDAAQAGWESVTDRPYLSTNSFVQSQLAMSRNLLVRIPDEVYQLVFAEITDGINSGEDLKQITERVEKVLSMTGSQRWPNRAKVIAQTEVVRAFNGGAYAAAVSQSQQLGIPLRKQWLATEDARTRPSHRRADGQEKPLADPFMVGGFPLLYPGDPMAPPEEVINCVPGSAKVVVPDCQVVYRFEYRGPLTRFTGELGLDVAVSPNHPILTEAGWKPASEIVEGDYVITTKFGDHLAGPGPNEKGWPATAEQVFSSAAKSGISNRVEGLAVNFHGDVPQSKIDVVFSNSFLGFDIHPSLGEDFQEFAFACTDAPTPSESTFFQFSVRRSAVPSGGLSFLDLIGALCGSHETPLHAFSLRLRPHLDLRLLKTTDNDASGDLQIPAKLKYGIASKVTLRKVLNIDRNVISTGHLYTFQTNTGIYLTDDTVAHNCRCTLVVSEEQ